jgi:hypothetical protein
MLLHTNCTAILAVLQFIVFIALAGRVRGQSGRRAPAVTGHEGFERMYRVQMNTLGLLIVFLPSPFLAGKYWLPSLVAGIGAVYLIGRLAYWRAYVSAPSTRILTISPRAAANTPAPTRCSLFDAQIRDPAGHPPCGKVRR